MGISLSLAYQKKYYFKKIISHISILFGASLSITIVTYIVFQKYFVYFGILHFITLAFILGLIFVRHSYLSLVVGTVIIYLSNIDILNVHFLYQYFQPILSLPLKTKDLVPFFPWFGVVLIGIFIGNKKLFIFSIQQIPFYKKIIYIGQHSLAIYLIHQPLLFGFFLLLSRY
jgi:uncharacterized membrane protein